MYTQIPWLSLEALEQQWDLKTVTIWEYYFIKDRQYKLETDVSNQPGLVMSGQGN